LEDPSTQRVSPEKLKTFCAYALQSVGLDENDALTTAEVLVTTDMWGTFSHGTNHLRNYIKKIRAGGINTKAKPEIILEGESWAIIDGHAAIGMVTAYKGMELSIQKAKKNVIGYVGVRNGNHFGAAGFYANMPIKHDMIGFAMSNADSNMSAPGGRKSVIGNNPFAYAAHAGEEYPIFLDIALSATAATKIVAAKAKGNKIPEGWIANGEGFPTTEIGDWPSVGSLLPMAGHKGYGLALLVEVLAAVLSGSSVTREVKGWLGPLIGEFPGTGHAFIAIDVGKIMPIGEFKQRMDEMIRNIKNSPKAKGSERIWLPGEMEWERRAVAIREGILLPEIVLNSLAKLAREVGRDFQDLFI
jgi:LDH2 family malate/lactate/ureidoglycolate dehydrogenase